MSSICSQLHKNLQNLFIHRFPFTDEGIPLNGIYVLFENGEFGHGGKRIVRIGTHTGDGNLRSRLEQHFVIENKDRSIFRKNVGRALLNRDRDPFLEQWNFDLTSRRSKQDLSPLVDFLKQGQIESQVTAYIQKQFEFVVFPQPERGLRLSLEAAMIATVSQCRDCWASNTWLGHSSTEEKIRTSGLWQVNGLRGSNLSLKDLTTIEG